MYSVSADRNSTKSRGIRRAKTHRPLSRPTPQTRMLTMGCEWRTVRSMGSIRFSMSFSSIRYMSLPCNSRQNTVTQYISLSNCLRSRCYPCAVHTCILLIYSKFQFVPRTIENKFIYFWCEKDLRQYKIVSYYYYIFKWSQSQKALMSFKCNCLTHSTPSYWVIQQMTCLSFLK